MERNLINIVHTTLAHINILKSWFPDKESSYLWCGPGLRYPFTDTSFLEDIFWQKMPTYSLLNEDFDLLGFGQYYEKSGRCHLARLVISPHHRSQGTGFRFISQLMDIGMSELNHRECSLFVYNLNNNALKCYRALHFIKADYPPDHRYYKDIDFMIYTKNNLEIQL